MKATVLVQCKNPIPIDIWRLYKLIKPSGYIWSVLHREWSVNFIPVTHRRCSTLFSVAKIFKVFPEKDSSCVSCPIRFKWALAQRRRRLFMHVYVWYFFYILMWIKNKLDGQSHSESSQLKHRHIVKKLTLAGERHEFLDSVWVDCSGPVVKSMRNIDMIFSEWDFFLKH